MTKKSEKKVDKVSIIGTGAWGTALAYLTSKNVENVMFYSTDKEKIKEFNQTHINKNYFPDVVMADNVVGTYESISLANSDAFIFAVPVQHLRRVLISLEEALKSNILAPIIICSKGIENRSNKLMSQVVNELEFPNPVVMLAGPNFAKDVIANKASATTIASYNQQALTITEEIFASDKFKVEKISDVIGLQICSAIKNIYAIGAGIANGLDLGENFSAAFIKVAINEMQSMLRYLNADSQTVSTYGGVGDLFLTCSSPTSRNFEFGRLIAKDHHNIKQLTEKKTIEGYYTLFSIKALLDHYKGVELQLINLIYQIVYNNMHPLIIEKII
ncbi:MAG: NAD(P)H-dependent glycerol-3-phosphate dehydrogenase [Candidatus Midichloria sp.]|uniref:Glycerol-3-phosphate dehydrogenase [NAD(+)] n=1 Tax=Hyalomma marginatum TaxID=34627 RepID=A0A8S4C0A6_9ACAR|nr:NAD(P)H-dependent glycerol-3-phosphate dehydrogenase [Hyalomma marginatum]CAG7592066.1 NAD(P)H-dependent glycerol-3-phosphate dehydrogenase [Hyalomma marginatum]